MPCGKGNIFLPAGCILGFFDPILYGAQVVTLRSKLFFYHFSTVPDGAPRCPLSGYRFVLERLLLAFMWAPWGNVIINILPWKKILPRVRYRLGTV